LGCPVGLKKLRKTAAAGKNPRHMTKKNIAANSNNGVRLSRLYLANIRDNRSDSEWPGDFN
jgi:hypothetical protein